MKSLIILVLLVTQFWERLKKTTILNALIFEKKGMILENYTKLINVQALIRAYRMIFLLKINNRTCTTIREVRVIKAN